MEKKVIVITGIGGMGLAVARRIGTGFKLVLADFVEDKLESAANDLRSAGYDVSTKVLDVSSKESVEDLAKESSELGEIRSVIHTAGLSPTALDAQKIFDVNLIGTALIIESFENYLTENSVGVMISSMAGYSPIENEEELKSKIGSLSAEDLKNYIQTLGVEDPGQAYVIAKKGNHFQVENAAVSWGNRGARIVSVSPGIISTPMAQKEMQEQPQMKYIIENGPIKRIGTPEDIALVVDFLQSDNASFITGIDVLVDGGSTAFTRVLSKK